ncbi:hypothetical protein ACFVHB_29605 [Kitasatospora sp. NPDC127111]|uniref:hypothetical protein n=1 Tax=Kitasatospora sp. NPDC127111 TaxID=3345363 RepID=UPI00363C932C
MDEHRDGPPNSLAWRTGQWYAHVLDLVKRSAGAVNSGHWSALADCSEGMSDATAELAKLAEDLAVGGEGERVGPGEVLAAAGDHLVSPGHEQLFLLLHPTDRPTRTRDGHGG